jgi:hypothetical protein
MQNLVLVLRFVQQQTLEVIDCKSQGRYFFSEEAKRTQILTQFHPQCFFKRLPFADFCYSIFALCFTDIVKGNVEATAELLRFIFKHFDRDQFLASCKNIFIIFVMSI